MLDDLTFPWTSFPLFSAWIRARPLAAPMAIFSRVSQSRGVLISPLFPANLDSIHKSELIFIICVFLLINIDGFCLYKGILSCTAIKMG